MYEVINGVYDWHQGQFHQTAVPVAVCITLKTRNSPARHVCLTEVRSNLGWGPAMPLFVQLPVTFISGRRNRPFSGDQAGSELCCHSYMLGVTLSLATSSPIKFHTKECVAQRSIQWLAKALVLPVMCYVYPIHNGCGWRYGVTDVWSHQMHKQEVP